MLSDWFSASLQTSRKCGRYANRYTWLNRMKLYDELEKLHESGRFSKKIKSYLLECCNEYVKYRSSGVLKLGLVEAKKYINGQTSWKQFHKYEWILEGESFGVEFYRMGEITYRPNVDTKMLNDLRKIRLTRRLTQKAALEFLEDITYFIVYVFEYVGRKDTPLPPKKYDGFMCRDTFDRYFGCIA